MLLLLLTDGGLLGVCDSATAAARLSAIMVNALTKTCRRELLRTDTATAVQGCIVASPRALFVLATATADLLAPQLHRCIVSVSGTTQCLRSCTEPCAQHAASCSRHSSGRLASSNGHQLSSSGSLARRGGKCAVTRHWRWRHRVAIVACPSPLWPGETSQVELHCDVGTRLKLLRSYTRLHWAAARSGFWRKGRVTGNESDCPS